MIRPPPRSTLFPSTPLSRSPDLVTLGKPMGNGYPVAAVITRREIAASLAATTHVFSTFGGNPVAAQAALAVLDVIEDERDRKSTRLNSSHSQISYAVFCLKK